MLIIAAAVAELEGGVSPHLTTAIRLDRDVVPAAAAVVRLLENACRLLSPVL